MDLHLDFLVPLLIPLSKASWAYYVCKPKKLPDNFFLNLLWRAFAFAGAVAYVYSVALTNLPSKLDINFYLTTGPLTIIGAAYILIYVWADLGKYLDASFRQPEIIPEKQTNSTREKRERGHG